MGLLISLEKIHFRQFSFTVKMQICSKILGLFCNARLKKKGEIEKTHMIAKQVV